MGKWKKYLTDRNAMFPTSIKIKKEPAMGSFFCYRIKLHIFWIAAVSAVIKLARIIDTDKTITVAFATVFIFG